MNRELSKKQRLIRWIVAAALVITGAAAAVLGPQLLAALNLPIWSEGDRGWNYVGVSAFLFFAAGVSVVNSTLSEKVRNWVWLAVVVVTVLLTWL